MPTLVRFLLTHAAIGFAIAIVFVGGALALDLGGLRTLMFASGMGYGAVALFTFLNALTIASVQMGVATMLLGEDDDAGSGGEHFWARICNPVRAWLAPPPQRAVVKIPPQQPQHKRR